MQELATKITDALAQDLSKYKFRERHDNVTNNVVGVVKKVWSPLFLASGKHGLSAVAVIPESVTDTPRLQAFFATTRKDINTEFVSAAAYKSSYTFLVLICANQLYSTFTSYVSELVDKTQTHTNVFQGVFLVDATTKEVTSAHTRPAYNKREYEAVLSAIDKASR